jgi:hypothetical protein
VSLKPPNASVNDLRTIRWSITDFGKGVGEGDPDKDTPAFQAAADSGEAIYLPDKTFNVEDIIPVTADGQRWVGEGKRTLIYQNLYGRMVFDMQDVDDVTIEGMSFAYPGVKTTRPSWSYNGQSSAINAKYNQDSTISRSAFIYQYGGNRNLLQNLYFSNVYAAIRSRSTDRFVTQSSDNRILDVFCKNFQFGVLYMNQINGVIDGLHGADTDSTDTAPPHLIYCAGLGTVPDDVTVLGKALTGVAATDLITTATPHYLSAGDIVAFDDLVGGAGLTEGAIYYVISSGLTATDMKVSTTPGGSAVNFTSDISSGTVTNYPDLDEDGDSDFANGTPDTPNEGGAIRNCTSRNNPWSFDFKIRNCRGVAISNLASYGSSGVMQCSWNQGMDFNGIRGFYLTQIRSQSTGLLVDTGTQVGAQINYCSHNDFRNMYMHTEEGQFVSGLGVRNNTRLNTFSNIHCDWKYPANTGNRSPYRLVDCNDNVFNDISWDSKGFDRAGFYFFNSDNNMVVRPRVRHGTTTWQKMFNADSDSTGNVVVIDPDLTNISPLTSSGMLAGAGTTTVKWSGAPRTGSKTWDPASVADGAMTSTTLTVTGAAVGEAVSVGFSTAVPAGAILSGSVTATDTVTVTLFNKTGGAMDLASGTLRAAVLRS